MKILAIESSCDETAAAVIGIKDGRPVVLSSVISSQVDLHAKTGGIVPEVASRAHVEAIIPVISEALIAASDFCHTEHQYCHPELVSGSKEEMLKPVRQAQGVSGIESQVQHDNIYSDAIDYLKNEIDFIAVTAGPGLIGSLLVGYNAAKTLAYSLDKPIIPINHIEGHIYSAFDPAVKFPLLSLTVSGGHTSLTLIRDHGQYENIGSTIDDAAGEAFDKVARLLDLGYPGGPVVSKLAAGFREKNETSTIKFPRPILNNGTFNFSFSGLKTAVLQKVLDIKKEIYYSCHPRPDLGSRALDSESQDAVWNDMMMCELSIEQKQEICAAFEDAAVDVLVTKTIRAVEKYRPTSVILAGGVAANSFLRSELESRIKSLDFEVKFLPAPRNLCGDNAAMIGLAAYYHVERGRFSPRRNVPSSISTWDKVIVDSNLEL